jgi:gamma-glutamylcysteine synthetase
MLAKVDDHVGYMNTAVRSYVVHRISPYKFGFDAEDFTSQTDLENFAKYCARATAYAHARADKDYDTTYVSYNFEHGALDAIAAWPSAKTTMATLGETYSDQVLADYSLFLELREDGEL